MQKRYTSFRVNPLKDKGEALEEIKSIILKLEKQVFMKMPIFLKMLKKRI